MLVLSIVCIVLLPLIGFFVNIILKYVAQRKQFQRFPQETYSLFNILVFLKNYFTRKELALLYTNKNLGLRAARKMKNHDSYIFWILNYPFLLINKPKYVELIAKNCLDKGFFLTQLKPFFAEGLISKSHSKWKKFRKLIQPSFHMKILLGFIPTMQYHTELLIKRLHHHIKENKKVDLEHLTARTTFNIICETALGISTENEDRVEILLKLNLIARDYLIYRFVTPILWPDFLFNLYIKLKLNNEFESMKQLINEVITLSVDKQKQVMSSQEAEISDKFGKREIFLDHLTKIYVDSLHDNNNTTKTEISIQDIADEVNNFGLAGFETIHGTVVWTLYCLGLNQNIQDKLYSEIISCLIDTEHISYSELENLNYLEMCIKEALRMFPPVPLLPKKAHQEFKIDESIVPQGTDVLICVWMIHHDPDIYPNPETYDPERFSPENVSKIPSGGYIPFGVGPRLCIGYKFAMIEMKIIIALIIKHFTIIARKPLSEIDLYVPLTLKATKDLEFEFAPRAPSS